MQTDIQWSPIRGFSNYLVNDMGEIYNLRTDRYMRTNPNNHGHMKITLTDHYSGERFDRSVAKLVADTFVEAPNSLCDHIVELDGDLTNVRADNLAWRPRAFAWKYARQLKVQQPLHYHNLRIENVSTGARYRNVIEAGMTEGLLFDDIWRSTYSEAQIFPHGHIFEVI